MEPKGLPPSSPPLAAPARGSSPFPIVAVSVAILGLVSYIDYATGYEFLFFVFYFIPVALCAWYVSRFWAVGMAILSGVSWFFVDMASEHHYDNEAIRYWNAFTCLLAFAVLGLLSHKLRTSLDQERRAREELARTLEELKRSTGEFRTLQSEFQVVCAWTHRIRIGGEWVPLDDFLREKLHFTVSHGISPEAFEEIKRSLEALAKKPGGEEAENKPVDPS